MVDGHPAEVLDFTPGLSAEVYYEVVRMIDGKFLFLEDHLQRLENSLVASGLPTPGKETIRKSLRMLQQSNAFKEGNIRICIQRDSRGEQHLFCYFIPFFLHRTSPSLIPSWKILPYLKSTRMIHTPFMFHMHPLKRLLKIMNRNAAILCC